jgi:uncharacterized protein
VARTRLAESTDCFHLAGVYDIAATEADLLDANVEGTRRLLHALAAAKFTGVLHHASSIAVAGDFDGTLTESMFAEGQRFPHAYHRSKFESERLVISNDEVAGFVAQSGGRLVGVGSLDISKPMAAVREVRRCVSELGFKAIRVLPWLWEIPPTDRRFYPVYTACCELDVPFCTQIGHTGPLMPSEVGRPIYLDQVALDFPELRIVAGHIGYPWTEEAIALVTKHENVYIDTSAYTVRRYPKELVAFMREHGRHKVMFGTNYPMITPAKALEGLEGLGLDDQARALFLGGNAARVFGLGDSSQRRD